MTPPRCAILLGYDPTTGTASTPVAAIAAHGQRLAVSWMPFTDGRSEAWRGTLAEVLASADVDWSAQLDAWATTSSTTQGLELVEAPDADDLRDAAEQVIDALLACPVTPPTAVPPRRGAAHGTVS
ncbi:MAG: hypothetical protein DLM61_22790 [Pseudonocardiales bacterium]|nr:MAG: hypothetical protein DLM61_22790 [Pseudonocardiales bacterium]